MEELAPFYIEYKYQDQIQMAEVKPCCEEDNIFYYDISINNKYQFTIAPETKGTDGFTWRLALKNADKPVDPAMIQLIGEQIDGYFYH